MHVYLLDFIICGFKTKMRVVEVGVSLVPGGEKLIVGGGAYDVNARVFLTEAFVSITLIRSCMLVN